MNVFLPLKRILKVIRSRMCKRFHYFSRKLFRYLNQRKIILRNKIKFWFLLSKCSLLILALLQVWKNQSAFYIFALLFTLHDDFHLSLIPSLYFILPLLTSPFCHDTEEGFENDGDVVSSLNSEFHIYSRLLLYKLTIIFYLV